MSTDVEFGAKADADAIRDRFSEHLCSDDDKRLKTVTFSSDTPEGVLDRARNEALDSRGERSRSHSTSLTPDEREKISELGGFDRTTTTASWASAKGVFAREGVTDQFDAALGSLTDYDDPAEGAEEWVARARRDDAQLGTKSVSGGARDVGEEDLQAEQQAADQARQAMSEECDHAEDHCRHGDPEACEYLSEVCGLSNSQVDRILEAEDVDEEGQFAGEVYGALSKLWDQYRVGLADAKQAAAGINTIRQEHGQDPMAFEELGDRRLTPDDVEGDGGETEPLEETPEGWDAPEVREDGKVVWEYDRDRMDGGKVVLMVQQMDRVDRWSVVAGYFDLLESVTVTIVPDRETAIRRANGWLQNQGATPPSDPDDVVQVFEKDQASPGGRITNREKKELLGGADLAEATTIQT